MTYAARVSAYRGTGPREPGCCACGKALEAKDRKEIALSSCASCGEQFVSIDAMVKIASSPAWQRSYLFDAPETLDTLAEAANRQRACPVCLEPMRDREHYLGTSETVRACAEHGVWFDGGQLVRVLRGRRRREDLVASGVNRANARPGFFGLPSGVTPIVTIIAILWMISLIKECR
jgi:Zn-finger nucleic acid-binding protein